MTRQLIIEIPHNIHDSRGLCRGNPSRQCAAQSKERFPWMARVEQRFAEPNGHGRLELDVTFFLRNREPTLHRPREVSLP